jgi:hypothetical protein
MVALMWSLKTSAYGLGIDEDTALLLQDEVGHILGTNGAYFFDMTKAKAHESSDVSYLRHSTSTDNEVIEVDDIILHYLTEGDSFNFETREITFAEYKTPLAGKERYNELLPTNEDIFNSPDNHEWYPELEENFRNVTTNLFDTRGKDSTYAYTWGDDPTFKIEFSRKGAEGFMGKSPVLKTEFTSYKNLIISVYDNDDDKTLFMRKK